MSSKTAPDPSGRSAPWSLAARLTLWYAVSSFVLIAASTGFLYWALIDKLEAEDDQFMAEKVELVRALLKNQSRSPVVLPGKEGAGAESGLVYLRVLGADGRVLLLTAGMEST